MKKKLKLKFVDFWVDINKPDGNYFYDLIHKAYDIEFSDDPEILFYSNYGTEHLKYRCIKIFFGGENIRPDFTVCDFAIGFEYSSNPRRFRFPLWVLYYLTYIRKYNLNQLDARTEINEIADNWRNKSKFCCFIVSNPSCVVRNNFFNNLNKLKTVDSAGRYLNNIGYFLEGGSREKLEFIKDYRFVISFENTSFPGYTTEKILEPLMAGCIPIYWGDPYINRDFNSKRFVNYSDQEDEKAVIDKVLEIDANEALALNMLCETAFNTSSETIEKRETGLFNFLVSIFDQVYTIHPRSKQLRYIVAHTTKVTASNIWKNIKLRLR